MYEIKVLPKDDSYIPTAEKAVAALVYAGIPGQSLVDVLPICTTDPPILLIYYAISVKHVPAWFPRAGFH